MRDETFNAQKKHVARPCLRAWVALAALIQCIELSNQFSHARIEHYPRTAIERLSTELGITTPN